MAPLPTYLRSHRRKWALTQRELAELLGSVSASAISKYESLARTPSADVMLALEIVFGETPASLFPALPHAVGRAVLRNAEVLHEHLTEKDDARSLRKRRLLEEMITRLRQAYETS